MEYDIGGRREGDEGIQGVLRAVIRHCLLNYPILRDERLLTCIIFTHLKATPELILFTHRIGSAYADLRL
jgi:hypothetical protein